ncbi:MAG: tetratricopeptide repeat protein, partial [Sulfurovaceae bacterium]|nr:tetratricopeptide repeat protein [Sulfurovaceae bacterium]
MKEYLTSVEHLAFRRISKIIDLRRDSSAIILLSANTPKLSNALNEYFLSIDGVEQFYPTTTNPLYELSSISSKPFYLINLYGDKNIDAIIKTLQFSRDFIAQYELKIILILDSPSYERLQERAYDFFSINSFSYEFIDHSYSFNTSSITQSSKLSEYIDTYNKYMQQENRVEKTVAQLLFNIAKESYKFSQISLALEYYQKALKICQQKKLKFEESAVLGNIGVIYSNKGDNDEALKYLKKALKIDEEIDYTQGMANQLGNIGLIYRDKGDNNKALKYLTEALNIDKEIGYTQGMASDLGNIGLIYSDKGDKEEALKYLAEALNIDK